VQREQAKYPLLAIANPIYQREPSIKKNKSNASVSELRSSSYFELMGGDFAPLPETEKEVKLIKKILSAPEESNPLQLRQNAARSNVFRLHDNGYLDDYRYIVFSCHGILPGEIDNVSQPALVLSLPDPETGPNGYLTMKDVFQLQLNAQFVTLSACNTGQGQSVKGEGVMGLTRAFMYAGTPSISVTLWSIETSSAAMLTTGFYANLKAGLRKAEALRKIKLRMIRGEESRLYRHPFFWAPMVIFGDGR
jgi:CHAT domain-containing protein